MKTFRLLSHRGKEVLFACAAALVLTAFSPFVLNIMRLIVASKLLELHNNRVRLAKPANEVREKGSSHQKDWREKKKKTRSVRR